ncbi:MAG: T9SS type A sorting domain-containing protein [Candidatus Cloacimonadales bacterium]|nr:T9SS type A sorting domain-containing protein [Candidatus Cloacimonadales bacterium]
MKQVLSLVIAFIAVSCYAQFNAPIQINDQFLTDFDGQYAYQIQGEKIYITYIESVPDTIEASLLRIMFSKSENNGLSFESTIIDSSEIMLINPVIEVFEDNTIIIIYFTGIGIRKAISNDYGNTFEIGLLIDDFTCEQIQIEKMNNSIYILYEHNCYEDNAFQTKQIESIIADESRELSQIEQNGIRPFPADAEIVYVKINGNSYSSMIGNIEHVGDSLFTVYNSYPDAAHPDFPIGDSIWVNEVAIYDTIWTAGPTGTLENQSVWVECTLWIEGTVSGMQSWGSPENIYITNDLLYENTDPGDAPDNIFNLNTTDFLCLYSEDKILLKYKHFDPFQNQIVAPNCDGDVYVYGMLIAVGEDIGNPYAYTGFVSFEYQHPHGSTPNFWWTDPNTGNQEYLNYIDLHKYIFEPTEPVPPELEAFVLHGNNPPAGYSACGFPYESPDYSQPDVPPYGTDYPWYNPVWPESSEDIVFERGMYHFWGMTITRKRGYIHRSGTDPFNHPANNEWDIANQHFDGYHGSTGYGKDHYYDKRMQFQKLIDISNAGLYNSDSFKILRSNDNGENFTFFYEENFPEAVYNLRMCANDSLLIVAYQEAGDPTINLLIFDENGLIEEVSIDLEYNPEIISPHLLDAELIQDLYLHIRNSDNFFFDNETEFILKYDLTNHEIENINNFETACNLTDFSISNGDVKVLINSEIIIDEINPEPLTLHFNYSHDDNWNNVYDLETEFTNFSPFTSRMTLNYSESDSLYLLYNVTDSLTNFGNIYLQSGFIDLQTKIYNQEIIQPEFSIRSYPNPFNPSTTIEFETTNLHELPRIEIYNLKGQKVKTLPVILSGVEGSTGQHSVVWNGDNDTGNPVSSGIYFYKLKVGNKTEAVKKCLMLK